MEGKKENEKGAVSGKNGWEERKIPVQVEVYSRVYLTFSFLIFLSLSPSSFSPHPDSPEPPLSSSFLLLHSQFSINEAIERVRQQQLLHMRERKADVARKKKQDRLKSSRIMVWNY